jgi:hypothetical protein
MTASSFVLIGHVMAYCWICHRGYGIVSFLSILLALSDTGGYTERKMRSGCLDFGQKSFTRACAHFFSRTESICRYKSSFLMYRPLFVAQPDAQTHQHSSIPALSLIRRSYPTFNMTFYTIQLALVVVIALLSSPSAIAVQRVTGESSTQSRNVPFYLKEDVNGNLLAVVYYGEPGDRSKEIEVECTTKTSATTGGDKDRYVGPGSIMCDCVSNSISSSSSSGSSRDEQLCELTVPFTFQRDASGTVVSVSYEPAATEEDDTTDDILVVPFYPQKNAKGETIGHHHRRRRRRKRRDSCGAL